MSPVISIIVPVYNVAPYLEKCVQSLIVQTLHDIEILLVDDGSTDNSGALCDALAQQDQRIKVIHKQNGGLSSARNCGVDHAQGSFVGFVDSDDYVEPTMFEVLYCDLTTHDADMSMCTMFNVYANRVQAPEPGDTEILSAQEAIAYCLRGNIVSVTAVNKLYPIELVRAVRFPEGKTTEDGFTCLEFLRRCRRITLNHTPLYYYEHRESTISTRPFNASTMYVVQAYEHNKKIVEEDFPALIQLANFRLYWAHFVVLDSMFVPGSIPHKKEQAEIVSYLRKHFSDIMQNPYFRTTRKIGMCALMINVRCYALLSWATRKKTANKV